MPRMTSLTLRSLFLIVFIIAVPVLALPQVTKFIDEALYGKSNATIPPVDSLPGAALDPPQQVIEPQIAERGSPASYDAPVSPAANAGLRSAYEGLDSLATAPPPLAPLPNFSPVSPTPSGVPAQPTVEIRETTISQVQQIRQRLEELGAKYILLETADGSGQFRFHCQMLLENSAYTRDFEATATDPLAAAQAVLRDVETWRTASRPAATRLE